MRCKLLNMMYFLYNDKTSNKVYERITEEKK